MQLDNQPRAEILPNCGHAAAEAHIFAAGRSARLLQSGVYAFRDKAKLGTARHPKRRARVMCQYEEGRVIRRLVAPPAFPAVVRPRTSNRTEHVAAKDPGTDPGKALLRNSIVDSRLSIVMAVHVPPYACVEEPLHQFSTPDAERIPDILVRSSTITIDGYCEAINAELRHYIPHLE